MPCAGSACCCSGGPPTSSGLGPRTVGARGLSPAPSCPRAVCVRCWGWSPPLSPLRPGPSRAGGSRAGVIGGPPVPPLRSVGTRFWVGGPPPPPPPRRPLMLSARDRLGGPLVSVLPLSSACTLSARWVPPSDSCSLLCGGFLCCCVQGSPPVPSLRAVGALLGGGSPSPFPPLGDRSC